MNTLLAMLPALAEININGMQLAVGLVGLSSALGVSLIGSKAAEAIGRNPSAFGSIFVVALVAMALAEGLAILVYYAVNR